METKDNPTGQSLGQIQPESGAQHHGGTRLRQALVITKRENKVLAAENAALKEQLATKELSWEQEKMKMRDEIDSLVSSLFMARNNMDSLEKKLESATAKQKQYDTECKEMDKTLKQKDEEVRSLKERLHLQQIETEKLREQLKEEECNKIHEMKCSFNKTLIELNAEWENRWSVGQMEIASKFKPLQEECENMKHVIQEKDKVITSVRTEMTALVEKQLETMDKPKTTEAQFHENEAQWQKKHKSLEDCLRYERAEKEESVKKTEVLHKQSRETKEKWITKEQDWISKENKLEEEINLLIQQNIKLQELGLKSDKEKARMKREEKKAKKEAEKRLKKEMKEKEEREKKEKKKEKERERKDKRGLRSFFHL